MQLVYRRLHGTKGALREEDHVFIENKTKIINWEQHFLYATEEYQQLKRVEFFNHRILHTVLRGRCSNIIVLNAHEPTEEKSGDCAYTN
jgi:hypothetical protein